MILLPEEIDSIKKAVDILGRGLTDLAANFHALPTEWRAHVARRAELAQWLTVFFSTLHMGPEGETHGDAAAMLKVQQLVVDITKHVS